MKNMIRFLLGMILVGILHADDAIAVTDLEALNANLGKVVTVVGVPNDKSTAVGQGHQFLHFDNSKFQVFCFRAVAENLPDGKKPIDYKGKLIRITGKLTLYNAAPQIVIRKAEQISLAIPAPPTPPPAEEKKDEPKKNDVKPDEHPQEKKAE